MGYVLTKRALDIVTSEKELCYILGYLATPRRINYIEAQVPHGKEKIFEAAYPRQNYDRMRPTSDKQSFQFRIILNYNGDCPEALFDVLSSGGGNFYKNCISRGRFIERLINEYGFEFSNWQNAQLIENIVASKHPEYIDDFLEGYNVPLSGECR